MRFLTLLCILFISACSTHIIDMTEQPTQQKYNLVDMEGDGVIAARDKCPDSVAGALVDNTGCGTEYIETLRRDLEVHFDVDSYIVGEEYFPEIQELADFMTEFPQVKVTIEGHTSITGSAAHNLVLSENRAQAIKSILVEQFAIDAARIDAIGYGFEQLVDTGNDEAAHARNRRIVAELSTDKNNIEMKWHIYSVDEEVKQHLEELLAEPADEATDEATDAVIE